MDAANLRLDPHADTDALTPSVDWIMLSVFPSHHPFFTNQRSVSKCQCLYEDSA